MQEPIMQKYKDDLKEVEKAIEEVKDIVDPTLKDKLWKIYHLIQEIINTGDVTKEDEEIKKLGYRLSHFKEWWDREKRKLSGSKNLLAENKKITELIR